MGNAVHEANDGLRSAKHERWHGTKVKNKVYVAWLNAEQGKQARKAVIYCKQ